MKDVELRLVAELMKDSHRSDRELAKVLGVSQPTVGRLIRRLQKEGVIKEYTMIPDFSKLGFNLMSIIMLKLEPVSTEELRELRKAAHELDNQEHRPYLLIMEGMGLGKNLAMLSFHRDYADYAKYVRDMRNAANTRMKAFMDVEGIEGFLIDLNCKDHYQPITFSKIGSNIQAHSVKEKQSQRKK